MRVDVAGEGDAMMKSGRLQQASGGRALLGVDPGADTTKPGKLHLLSPLPDLRLMTSDRAATNITWSFSRDQDFSSFCKDVQDKGWSSALKFHYDNLVWSNIVGLPLGLELGSNRESNKSTEVKITRKAKEVYYIYCVFIPMKAFQMSRDEMRLSEAALRRARAVKNRCDAEDFLKSFSPFASERTHHLGGVFLQEFVTRDEEDTTFEELSTKSKGKLWDIDIPSDATVQGTPKLSGSLKARYASSSDTCAEGESSLKDKVSQNSQQIITVGPNTATDEMSFRCKLNEDPSSWAIIDKDPDSEDSLVGVWDLLLEHAQSLGADGDLDQRVTLQKAAECICHRWLEVATGCASTDATLAGLIRQATAFLARCSEGPMSKEPPAPMIPIAPLPVASKVSLIQKLQAVVDSAEGLSHREAAKDHIRYFIRNADMDLNENREALHILKEYGFDGDGNLITESEIEIDQVQSMIEELNGFPYPATTSMKSSTLPSIWRDVGIKSLVSSSSCELASTNPKTFSFVKDVVVDRDFYSKLKLAHLGPSAHFEQAAAQCLIDCLRHRLDSRSQGLAQHIADDGVEWAFDSQGDEVEEKDTEGERVFLLQLLIQIFQASDLSTQIALCNLLLSQRAAAPLIIPSSANYLLGPGQQSGVPLKHHIEALNFVDVVLEKEQRVCIATDTVLPRVVFLSNKEVQASHAAVVASQVLNCDFMSQDGQPAKMCPVVEAGVGFVHSQNQDRYCPCLSFLITGPYCGLGQFVEAINADVVVLEQDKEDCSLDFKTSAMVLRWRDFGKDDVDRKQKIIQGQQNYLVTHIGRFLVGYFPRIKRPMTGARATLVDVCPALFPPHKLISFKKIEEMVKHGIDVETCRSGLILQRSYVDEAQAYFELVQQKDNPAARRVRENKCNKERMDRASNANKVMSNPLMQIFHELLIQDNAESRRVGLLCLERTLSMMMRSTLETASQRVDAAFKAFRKDSNPLARQDLVQAKQQYVEKNIGLNNLWREMWHIYVADPSNQQDLPRHAAQHLLDGFPLEILDGDAGMFCADWVGSVLVELDVMVAREMGRSPRLFVLSVMGLQSSGKSTILNLMFGTQLKASAGQCTRGVYMQLVPSERAEYDYVLVLDTEGLRSPEYFYGLDASGSRASEGRDNLMATFALLPADASIFMVPNEDDTALKEILPIVLLAFKSSAIAENCGGRIKAKMAFVYRSVDINDVKKLKGNEQKLFEYLREAADQVAKMGNSIKEDASSSNRSQDHELMQKVFSNFRVHLNEEESDVKYMGNLRSSGVPPKDTPDWAYGKRVIELREYIHKRAMQDDTGYKAWSFKEWAEHLTRVWNCVSHANFELNFRNTMEYISYKKMQIELRKPRATLLKRYMEVYENLEKEIMNMKEEEEDSSGAILLNILETRVQEVVEMENEEVERSLGKWNWGKWRVEELENWRAFCARTREWYGQRVEDMGSSLVRFERVVTNYERRMKFTIVESIERGAWKLEQGEEMRRQKFEELFRSILKEAEEKHPPGAGDVTKKVFGRYKEYGLTSRFKELRPTSESYSVSSGSDFEFEELAPVGCLAFFNNYHVRALPGCEVPTTSSSCGPLQDHQVRRSPSFSSDRNYVETNLQTIVQRQLKDLKQYSHLAVNTVIEDTLKFIEDTPLISRGPGRLAQEGAAHNFVKTILTERLQSIQQQWDKCHNVAENLRLKAKPRLWRFFEARAQGLEAVAMLIPELQGILEDELLEAHKLRVVRKVAEELSRAPWVIDSKVLRNLLDYHLLTIMEFKNQQVAIDIIVPYICNEQHHFQVMTHALIMEALGKAVLAREWEYLLKKVEKCLTEQAQALVLSDSCTVGVFLAELAQKLDMDVDSRLASFITSRISEDVYEGQVVDSDFFQNKVPSLCKSLRQIKPFERLEEVREDLAERVTKRMEEAEAEQCKPRCEEVCPLCGSACMHATGHSLEREKHDAVHQPAGLCGNHYYDTDELVEETCLDSVNEKRQLRLRDGKVGGYTKFEVAFEGWSKPSRNEDTAIALRQCIFRKYQEALVRYYATNHVKPCPSHRLHSCAERDADSLRASLRTKLRHSYATDESSWNQLNSCMANLVRREALGLGYSTVFFQPMEKRKTSESGRLSLAKAPSFQPMGKSKMSVSDWLSLARALLEKWQTSESDWLSLTKALLEKGKMSESDWLSLTKALADQYQPVFSEANIRGKLH